ncbi:MAG: NADH-quinone oxidoreductase subunit H [Actinomycetota bacterium]|nr:NADH-quinone oxidoreductase subunit H [Actinomycetota bacterium]
MLGYVGDPIFAHGLHWQVWLIVVVKVLLAFALLMLSVLFMVMYERKAVAWLGVRYGPNRAGPGGWLQSLADGVKLFFKEAFTPARADKWVYKAAPYLVVIPAFVAFSIVPIGGTVNLWGWHTRLQVADPPWGILLMLMASGVTVYGVMLAGWASGSKYPLLGSVRASAQMVSYEAVLGLTVATVVLETGSLQTSAIWLSQRSIFYHWNFLRTGLIPFALFAIAITAEMTRAPFDLVEAEEELSGGFNLEYSSIAFALFYLAEYMALVTNSAIMVTLWFGGPDGPFIATYGWLGIVWFALKTLIILYIFVWIRATLPRMRYDQLMELGWKRMIPVALAMLLVVAGFQVSYEWGFIAVGGSLVALAVLLRAIDVGSVAASVDVSSEEVAAGGPATGTGVT